MAKIKKTIKVNTETEAVLKAIVDSTNSTKNRVIEAAITAYGAKILGFNHAAVSHARWQILKEANKFRKI